MSAVTWLTALRAIGRDLETRGVKTFALRCAVDRYVVEAGYQSPPAPTPLLLHYTIDDIRELECEEQKSDDRDPHTKDFLSLAQIFPAMGAYVCRKGARLLGISNNGVSPATIPVITIEYETVQGERVVDTRTVFAIYDMCVYFHKLNEKFSSYPVSI